MAEADTPRRPQARGRITRARILRAADELIPRRGYAGTTIGDVALRAGVAVGTVYHHFPDKRSLLLALLDDWAERILARRSRDLDLGSDPSATIRRWLRSAYDRERKQPSLYVVVLGLAGSDPEVRRRYQPLERRALARLRDLIERGQQRGAMRPDVDAEAAAFLVHHAIDMAATQLLVREIAEPSADRVLESLVDMICRYLLEDGPERTPKRGGGSR